MKLELLDWILKKEQGVTEPTFGIYLFADDLDVTLLFDVGHEVLTIVRVKEVEITNQGALINTQGRTVLCSQGHTFVQDQNSSS